MRKIALILFSAFLFTGFAAGQTMVSHNPDPDPENPGEFPDNETGIPQPPDNQSRIPFLPDPASETAGQVLNAIRAGLDDLGLRLSELLGGSTS